MIDVALVNLLTGAAPQIAGRVFSGGELVKVDRERPNCVYTLIATIRRYSDDGPTGLTQGRYQIDIFAALPSEARAIADAIRQALDNWRGTNDQTKIERIYFDNERHGKPERAEGDTASIARFIQDIFIEYRE